jgi:glycosyltransferase involved in cell wall biosynthesis
MRIIVVSPSLPWPLDSGGNAAQYTSLKCLAADHEFVLISPVYGAGGARAAQALGEMLPEVTIRGVFCGLEGTLLRRAAARFGRRFLDGSRFRRTNQALQPLFNPFSPLPRPFVETVSGEIRKGCDLFQAEYSETLQLGPWVPRSIPKLFVHYQPHAVYTRRAVQVGDGSAYSAYLKSAMEVQEIAFLRHFDAIITFSEPDRDALLPSLPPGNIFVSPFPLPTDVPIVTTVSGRWDGRFVFLASGIHSPNRDALAWLLTEIWPDIISELPDSSLHVVGSWSKSSASLYSGRNLKFTGFVDDLQGILRNAILLVPLRIGSGIRVKILAAMASGVPVISTSIGSEGLPVASEVNIITADQPKEFSMAAVDLAANPERRERIATGGLQMVKRFYSPEIVRQRRNEVYRETIRLAGSFQPPA